MSARWVGVGLVAGFVAACTAGVRTEVAEPIRPVAGTLALTELALLPVTAVPGSEDAAPTVAAAARTALDRHHPGLVSLEADEARRRLGEAGVASALAALLRDYESTGVADRAGLDAVTRALGVDHFLQLRVGFAESEVLREELFSDEVSDEERREVVIVARLWGAGGTAPLWEATARADSETGSFTTDIPGREEMLGQVVARLLERLPVRAGPRP